VSAAARFHRLRIAGRRAVADDAIELRFEPPAGGQGIAFDFQPGQHLALRATVAGREERRSYSLCRAPGAGLAVGVRQVPGGRFSNWLAEAVRVGAEIEVWPPEGRFGAALASGPGHILAVAGGSGITPIKALLEAQLAAGRRATLLYANRTLASTMFLDEIVALKDRHLGRFTLHLLHSREETDSGALGSGRTDQARLATVLRAAGGVAAIEQAFVCGPAAFNDAVQADLLALGLPPERLHLERFGVPAADPERRREDTLPAVAQGAELVVIRDGRQRRILWAEAQAAGHANVLAAATAAGLDLPYSCRSGVCATCRARVLEGTVAMLRNFALEAADLAAGDVLTCQAVPTSERVVISFDAR
jgi:ring-1,2-phenylacetyl-CoA epoxidase subunit PaaE